VAPPECNLLRLINGEEEKKKKKKKMEKMLQ
jgi:hypothetical protein